MPSSLRRRFVVPAAGLALVILSLASLPGSVGSAANQVSVTTQHNDNARTGANLSETILTTSNVNLLQFGKLFERSVDDEIYGQPLYVPNLSIAGQTRNVVFVATVNDTVYAFDADDPAASAYLWRASLLPPGSVPGSTTDDACLTFFGNIGIVGTPVIDLAATPPTMYLVARTKETSTGAFTQTLHALNILTGEVLRSKVIQASVTGTGDGGTQVTFNPTRENNRSALLLSGGIVYTAWGAYCDKAPYHGWILGHEANTLLPRIVFNSTPDASWGGIWQAGQGPAADADGFIYAMTGNGPVNGPAPTLRNLHTSFVKISPATSATPGALTESFTPFNFKTLSDQDKDLGLEGPLLLPEDTNRLVGAGKDGKLYLLNRTGMGGFQSGSDSGAVQTFQASTGRADGSPVYWKTPANDPTIYLWGANDVVKAYKILSTGLFQTTPVSKSTTVSPAGRPGGLLSLSANGSAPGTGIVWGMASNGGDEGHVTQPGILRAFDATNLAIELWNSEQRAGAVDRLGNLSKSGAPTIANGKVYVSTFSGKLVVYGLLNTNPDFAINASPASQSVNQGTGAVYTVNVTPVNAFLGDVHLSSTAGSFTPSADIIGGSGSATLMVPTDANTPAGPSTITITGTSGSLSHAANVSLTVQRPDFTIALTPATQIVAPGAGTSYTVTVTSLNGFNGPVALGVSGLPAGATGAISPLTISGGAGTATLTATAGATLGTSTITVTGTSGTLSHGAGASFVVSAPGASGTGLLAKYYNDPNNGTYFNTLVLTRTDATVNFNWASAAPATGVTANDFSVVWTGQVQAPVTGTITFYTTSDDGVRLWVNGQQVINNWTVHAATTNSGTTSLVAGVSYDIRMEFFERSGAATARLLWSYTNQAQQTIPQSRLFPGAATNPPPATKIQVANVRSAIGNTSSSFIDLAYTVPNLPGQDLLLVVYAGSEASTTNAALPVSATFNGRTLTRAAAIRTPASGTNNGSGIFWMPVQVNETGTIRLTFTGTCIERGIGASTLVGANPAGPTVVETTTGTASLTDLITTTTPNALVISTATQGNAGVLTATGTGHVRDFNVGPTSSQLAGGHAEAIAPGTLTLGYSAGNIINRIAMVLAAFQVSAPTGP